MSKKLKPLAEAFPHLPPHFAQLNDRTGLIELVCAATGRLLLVQGHTKSPLELKWDDLVRYETPEGVVFLEKGLNLDYTRHIRQPPFSKMLGDLICEQIVEGKSRVLAAQTFNVKYSTLRFWERENEDFKLALQQAEKDRADYYFEESMELARRTSDLKGLQWGAEKSNPEKYGNKTKISGDANAPIQFVIDTGIRRTSDPGAITQAPESKDVTPQAVVAPDEKKDTILESAEF